jgi:hypothetical protein
MKPDRNLFDDDDDSFGPGTDLIMGASHIGMSINTYEALWSKKGKDR